MLTSPALENDFGSPNLALSLRERSQGATKERTVELER